MTELLEAIKNLGGVGPFAAAAFGAVFLAGVALSFFWKYFGPWQQLKEAHGTLTEVKIQLEECQANDARTKAEMADLSARYSMLIEAMTRSGIAMVIGKPD